MAMMVWRNVWTSLAHHVTWSRIITNSRSGEQAPEISKARDCTACLATCGRLHDPPGEDRGQNLPSPTISAPCPLVYHLTLASRERPRTSPLAVPLGRPQPAQRAGPGRWTRGFSGRASAGGRRRLAPAMAGDSLARRLWQLCNLLMATFFGLAAAVQVRAVGEGLGLS